MVEIFEVGPCEDGYELGFLIGQRFSHLIRNRLATDPSLQNQLLPFSHSPHAQSLIQALSENNRKKFPRYWDELIGTAEGSGVPQRIALMSLWSVIPWPLLIRGILSDRLSFIAYTYAGELPSCAFGFNNRGLQLQTQAFTLNSVPPTEDEIVAGGIGRNFISRDILEATSIEDALTRIRASEVSVGHSYNLIDLQKRKILNVETASKYRISVYEVGPTPFFHANMYLHLQIQQVHDENSTSRQKRAALLPKESKQDFLSLLGDTDNTRYPIYMTGPTLCTLCTAVIDLDEQELTIIEGNPKKKQVSHVFSMSSSYPL